MKIIYFDIDCLRPDHLGCYGYNRPASPNIDAIAGQGPVFTRYYCGSSPCLPSRTGWVSGRYGIQNGVCSNTGAGADFHIRLRDYGGPEDDNELFLRNLRRHGFDTISISNFADRHNAYYFMCGWSEFYTPNLKGGSETAPEINDVVFRWLNNNKNRDNYLLHINYWDTHRTYRMDASWAQRFDDYPVSLPWPDEDAIAAHQDIKGPFTATGQFRDNDNPPALMPRSIKGRKDFEKMVTAYDTSIAYVDYHIGLILDFLNENGGLEDTAVIITSDHGDALGEHGIYTDHVCADECIHHIPLVIKWPDKAKENQINDALLYNIDVPPTICDLMNFSIPSDWDGKSFKNCLAGKSSKGRDYLVWDHALYTVQRAVRTGDYLLIHTYDDFGYGMKPVELFDMKKDPYETENISDKYPKLVMELDTIMESWKQEQKLKGYVSDPLQRVLDERKTQSITHK
jgi:arylsulfatase A-like enzyme